MPDLGDWWWVPILAVALGSFVAPIIGYSRRPRNGNGRSTISSMHGAAMIDSSLGERVAAAFERLVEIEAARDKRKAAERHDSELETLRREIEELKRSKR